jgi:hypothetical protein
LAYESISNVARGTLKKAWMRARLLPLIPLATPVSPPTAIPPSAPAP